MPIIDTWVGDKISLNVRALMGFGGVIINDSSHDPSAPHTPVDVLDMMRAYMEKAAGESCGQCFPCRSGLKNIAKRLNLLCEGISSADSVADNVSDNAQNNSAGNSANNSEGDIAYLLNIANMVMSSARCDIGQTSPKALVDIINKAPHLLAARKVIKGNYTSLVTAPCMNACPGHVDIPTYIEKIRLRQFDEGLSRVMEKCSMPGTIGRVCERPCETACKRGQNGAPVAIRHLKRFLFDRNTSPSIIKTETALPNKTQKKKQKIAVIGAGPAGLSCAYHLSKRGFPVTIFEKQQASGGMAKYGIPDYRLPASVLEKEVACVRALGCEIHYGVDVGSDVSIQELMQQQNYAAVFIGSGAPDAPGMRCAGEGQCTSGYISGIEYLNEATRGNKIISGKRLAVVGGGNVAMDCVRTALRHGFTDVHIIYRRTEQEMPADKFEIHEAKLEGVTFNFLVAPTEILHDNGHVTGLLCQRMELGEPDDSGRRSPVPIKGEIFEFECDAIIHAIGQKVTVGYILEGLAGTSSTGMNEYNNLEADSITGEVPAFSGIFGGGDCATGPRALIAALAAGERAAAHITAYVEGKNIEATEKEKLEHALQTISIVNSTEIAPPTDMKEPMPLRVLPVSERLQNFSEVEQGSTDWEACKEASRCLRCFRILMVAS